MMVGGFSFSAFNLATMDRGLAMAADAECTSILPGDWCNPEKNKNGDAVFKILNLVLYVITAGVGILGMIGVIITGVQYATAGDNDGQVAEAKGRIKNIVIGLVLWAAFFALVKWLTLGKV